MDVTAWTVVVICATNQNVGGEEEIVPLVQLVTAATGTMVVAVAPTVAHMT